MGKLSDIELRKLLSCIKADKRVTVPPMLGYDSGVHRLGDMYMVVSTDPCIGVPQDWFGWLLVNYAASDVALFGAKPEFCTITLLGPVAAEPQIFQGAMSQACGAADELGMAVVTGHTGTYEGLPKLIGVCTAYGTVKPEKLITPGNAKPEDLILCTKMLGLEAIVNFSLVHKALAHRLFGAEQAKRLTSLVPMQSCVREALQLSEIGGVHAMHDATEGGLVVALNEMAEASGVGFSVDFERLPFSDEAEILRSAFGLSETQMLSVSSTGTVLAAVDPADKQAVEEILRRIGVSGCFLGAFTKSKVRLLVKNGESLNFPRVADDPYDKVLSGKW
jgi:hydrogenase expression/formation protein HypE